MDKYTALKKYFGYTNFRNGQEKIIDDILGGSDVLAVMPTGAGKSLCFQIPALMKKGTAIVISPLISLMKDQVFALKENGIGAETINSGMNRQEIKYVCERVKNGGIKLLYVSPERLNTQEFLSFISDVDISFVCVDEAHCVSQWGQDFRSSYLEITQFLSNFRQRPSVCAFTATATDIVREDICRILEMREPLITVTGFDRKNLFFQVMRPGDKFTALRKCLDTHSTKSSIVYCSTRKTVNEVYQRLISLGYNASKYHAGLLSEERKYNQELFIKDKVRIMVATNAFGMGIDKSDVSLVVHYNMPGDIESYYQEAGRAGRDGLEADCILLFSPEDIRIQEYFIDHPCDNEHMSEESKEFFRKRKRKMLDIMKLYCTGKVCLRSLILRYFGENASDRCENCSVCCAEKKYTDITVESQKVLSAVARTKGQCSREEIIGILKADAQKYSHIKTYGAMKNDSGDHIEEVINCLITGGFIEISTLEAKTILRNTKKAANILFGGESLSMSSFVRTDPDNLKKAEAKADLVLFTVLKILRKNIAERLSIPPLAVFTDRTLRQMSALKPTTVREMRQISGMSDRKLEKYAPLFIREISIYIKKQ